MIVRLATHADRLPKSSQRRSCLLAEPKDTAKSLDEAISVQPLVNSRGAGLAYDFFRFLRRPLVTAAIVLWNTAYLERATNALNGHGKPVDETLFQYLSPLGWEHINLTGDYLWRSSTKVGAGKFRPLRPLPPA